MNIVKRSVATVGLSCSRGLGRLSPGLARRLVSPLSMPMRRLMRRRRLIAQRNLELCFPEWAVDQRSTVLRQHFRLLAESVADISQAWHRDGKLDEDFGTVEGLDYLDAARSSGRGVLLITGHVTCLELGARLFGERVAAAGIYRPLRNELLNRVQNQSRQRYARQMIPRDDLRQMVRHLRAGGILWYAPDQDFGVDRSLFVPFFNQPAATARGMAELARLGRAAVVPMYPLQDPVSRRVTVLLKPEIEAFAQADPAPALAAFNAFLEQQIRRSPAQYWWLHRRFKSAPEGVSDRYADLASARK